MSYSDETVDRCDICRRRVFEYGYVDGDKTYWICQRCWERYCYRKETLLKKLRAA